MVDWSEYDIEDEPALAILNEYPSEQKALTALVEKHAEIKKLTAADGDDWYKKYGVTDEAWTNVVSRYKTQRDALDGLVEKHKQISSSLSAPSKDLEPDDYAVKVSEMRRNVTGIKKPDDYIVNIPDELKEEVSKRNENFEKDVKEKAFEYARTQAEVDADVEDAMKKLRDVITAEKDEVSKADASKVRNRQELENIFGKRVDEEIENGRLVLRHYDNSQFFNDNQKLYPEEVIAEKGGFLEQFFTEHDNPILRRWLSSIHGKILAEGDFVEGTKTGMANSMYKERYERAKKSWPKRGEKYWDEIAKSQVSI